MKLSLGMSTKVFDLLIFRLRMMEQRKKLCAAPKKALAFEQEDFRRFLMMFPRKCRYTLVRAAFAVVCMNGCNRIGELAEIIWGGKRKFY